MRALPALAMSLALAALPACEANDFDLPDLVTKPRVLAGSAVLAADPARVTPQPGESASYRLLVGGPAPEVRWTYLLAVCRLVRDANGAPACDVSFPFLGVSGAQPSVAMPPELPSVEFTVPEPGALREDEDELVVQGLVCPDGAFDAVLLAQLQAGDYGALVAGRNPCADKSKNGVVLASPLPIARTPDAINHAPQILSVSWSRLKDEEDDEEVVKGDSWPTELAPGAPLEGCKGKGFLELKAGDRLGVQLELDAGARETYLDPSPIPGEPPMKRVEIPQVQGLASAGKFEIVRDNQLEAAQLLELAWKPDADPPASGLLVRFWFLATDDRYGDTQATSWQARVLCVLAH
jgi:hypothetical protein